MSIVKSPCTDYYTPVNLCYGGGSDGQFSSLLYGDFPHAASCFTHGETATTTHCVHGDLDGVWDNVEYRDYTHHGTSVAVEIVVDVTKAHASEAVVGC